MPCVVPDRNLTPPDAACQHEGSCFPTPAHRGDGRMQPRLMSSLSLGQRCGVSSREAINHFGGLLKHS